jgi:signal transduction histidine kinase
MQEKRQPQLDRLQAVSRASEHLLSLIDDVLDISRIESGRQHVAMTSVSVDAVVTECVELVAQTASSHQLTLTAEPVPTGAGMLADRSRLKQVLANLLSNAVKYTPAGGSIRVSVSGFDGPRTRISVADTGPGIAEDLLPRLYDPFDRLGAEHTTTPGTGLGLALCRRVVESMGGRIGVESFVGRGSTFWVELETAPVTPVPSPERAHDIEAPVGASLGANRAHSAIG